MFQSSLHVSTPVHTISLSTEFIQQRGGSMVLHYSKDLTLIIAQKRKRSGSNVLSGSKKLFAVDRHPNNVKPLGNLFAAQDSNCRFTFNQNKNTDCTKGPLD